MLSNMAWMIELRATETSISIIVGWETSPLRVGGSKTLANSILTYGG
tara:strand:+ start:223 stop:363 length:141 start_codon:yes stop_codon:yes gene_type:complete